MLDRQEQRCPRTIPMQLAEPFPKESDITYRDRFPPLCSSTASQTPLATASSAGDAAQRGIDAPGAPVELER